MGKRKAIFASNTFNANFANEIYKLIKSGKEFSYEDILRSVCGEDELYTYVKGKKIKKKRRDILLYGNAKKAFYNIKKIIEDNVGKGCIAEYGTNRNRTYRYCGNIKDPLADYVKAKYVSDLKQYAKFCQDSAGFIPVEWLEYFFKDTMDLENIKLRKSTGRQTVYSSSLRRPINKKLDNTRLLPEIHKYITDKKVLEIEYAGKKPPFDNHETLVFHPQLIREYNGRWQIYGHADGKKPYHGYKIALDRIIGEPREIIDNAPAYVEAPPDFYDEYFKNVIGATHLQGAVPEEVRIRTHSEYMHWLVTSKPFHDSQSEILPFGRHEDGRQYGEITVTVEINNEFIGVILQLGDGLEIVAPEGVRKTFAERIRKMASMYSDVR